MTLPRLFEGPKGTLLLVFVLLAIFGCQCGNPVPTNDTCSTAESSGVDTLELGPGGDDAFRPFATDEKVKPVRGGQGASMLTVRLRVGPKGPQCLAQKTTVTSAFDPTAEALASLETPTPTFDDPSGKRATKTLYLIGGFGGFPSRVRVVTTVGTKTLDQTFALEGTLGCYAVATCQQTCLAECDQCAAAGSSTALPAVQQVNDCVATFCPTDAGRPDGGDPCRAAAIQDSSQCKDVWSTCESTQ